MEPTTFTELDIQNLRAETKGTAGRIHFNNAGASLPPDLVVDAVVEYLKEEATNGGYETESKHQQQLDNTYTLMAMLINAQKDEIALVENASMAWCMAFNGIEFKAGDEVLTSEMEYVTNLIGLLNVQKTLGVKVRVVANDEAGNFSLAALEAAISPRTKLIAVTHIASTTGGMLPVIEIGKIARKHNILYLLDACQSVGQAPVDVAAIGCDMLAVTGRKYLRAPRGTGFLYVRKAVQDNLKLYFMDGHSIARVSENDFKLRDDARRFELYEKSRALTLGLAKAVEYALNLGIDKIWQRIQHLANLTRQQLSAIDGVTIHDTGNELCGIVTFSVRGMDAALVKQKLAEKHINVSVGKALSTLFFMNKHGLSTIVRASVHYYNTEEEVQVLCGALKAMLAGEQA